MPLYLVFVFFFVFVDLNMLGVFSTNGFEEELVTKNTKTDKIRFFVVSECWLLKKKSSVKIVLTTEVDLIFL